MPKGIIRLSNYDDRCHFGWKEGKESSTMAIINIAKKRNPYVVLDKTFLVDPNLSAKAKGLLAYLLSLPADWQIHIKELTSHFTDGAKSVYTGIQELKARGYILHQQKRRDTGSYQQAEYFVYEEPQIKGLDEQPKDSPPYRPFRHTVKRHTVKRDTENRHLINNNNTNSTFNKKITAAKDAAVDFDSIGSTLVPEQISCVQQFVKKQFPQDEQSRGSSPKSAVNFPFA